VKRALLAVATALVYATPGNAAQLTDGNSFALDLSVANPAPCVILPEQLQRADDCPGIDRVHVTAMVKEQVKKSMSPPERLVAMMAWPRLGGISLMAIASPPDVPSREGLNNFLAGYVSTQTEARLRRDDHGDTWSRLVVGGTPAIRFFVDAPRDVTQVGYCIYGSDGAYRLIFIVPPGHEQDARTLADALLPTLKLAPLSRTDAHLFAETVAFRIGYRTGSIFGRVLLLLLLVSLAIRFGRRRRGKQSPPPPPPAAPQ
jgi:hypothetical protein